MLRNSVGHATRFGLSRCCRDLVPGRIHLLFTRDTASVFGDWLERERIRHALLAARPELDGTLVLDEERPLLRNPFPGGTELMVAKTAAGSRAVWVAGVPHPQTPTVHETSSIAELVQRVLEAFDTRAPRTDGTLQPE